MNTTMTRRERKKQLTKQNMLTAAKHLFREKGYHATYIEDITERADVSKSTLFKHFPNKESLLIGLAEEEVKDVLSLLESLDQDDEIHCLKTILMRLIEDAIPYLTVTGQALFTTLINKQNVQSPFMEIRKVVEDLVSKAQEKNKLTKDYTPKQIGVSLMSCYYGVLFSWYEQGSQTGNSEEMEVALSLIFKGLEST